ncbi:hypothetical protein [Litorilituus sediminis]|uniref:Uncharacterized protein n=1 Tax=Litorilituus sediminis TaxID=718192 RepID=A0A4P6P848_9GAMM|nr:hypothetical protein [Litorilituus sediminis]QBG35607.1 hypothetical protein EMK97_07715 [Litorilituus sediminis]
MQPEQFPEQKRSHFYVNDQLEIIIEGVKCLDAMSGEQFASKVTIITANRRLTGCGRALH